MLRRGSERTKLEAIVNLLRHSRVLPQSAQAHKLQGEWDGFWECHIESNWLLIYDVTEDTVLLARTGTHADLFE